MGISLPLDYSVSGGAEPLQRQPRRYTWGLAADSTRRTPSGSAWGQGDLRHQTHPRPGRAP